MNFCPRQQEESIPNYGYKGFHKTNYENPPPPAMEDRSGASSRYNKRTSRFTRGVEQSSSIERGLLYGSDQNYGQAYYSRGGRLDNRTSSELGKMTTHYRKLTDHELGFKEQKMRRNYGVTANKEKDFEYPWGGQVGGGAPRVTESGKIDSRFKGERQDIPTDGECYDPFGRSGGGAPIKTNSGNRVTTLVGDPDIRFQKQLKREVEQSLRYKSKENNGVGAGSTVETQNQVPNLTRTPSEIEQKLADKRKKELYALKLDEQRADSQERRRAIEIRENETDKESFNPWGRDQPQRDDSGKIPGRRRKVDTKGVVDVVTDDNQWWLKRLPDKPVTVQKETNILSSRDQQQDEYNPWGKPGGGAPISTTDSGKPVGKLIKKLDNETDRHLSDIYRNGHGITMAEWLRRQPKRPENQPNQSNDIQDSKQLPPVAGDYYNDLQEQANQRQLEHDREKNERLMNEKKHAERVGQLWPLSDFNKKNKPRMKRYHDELQRLVEEKQKLNKLEKEKKYKEENKHVLAFNQFWGRPGGGAPRVNENHQIDVSPRSYGALSTFMTHTGQHKFRR